MINFLTLSFLFLIPIIFLVILIKKKGFIIVGKTISRIEVVFIIIIYASIVTMLFKGEGLYLFVLFGPLMIYLLYIIFPVSLIGILVSIKLIKNDLYKKQGVFLLVLSLILGGISIIQYYGDVTFFIKEILQSNVAKNTFDEISEKLKEPQKVVAMDSSTFILEGGLRVSLIGLFPVVFQRNPNIENDINKFGNENIVGNHIKVVLPRYTHCNGTNKRTYRDCFGEHGNLDHLEVYGNIYFNDQLLNEKFNLVPTY